MSDFGNFLCFFFLQWRGMEEREVRKRVGETAEENQKGKCGGEGKRRKREERSLFSLSLIVLLLRNLRSFASALPVPPHRTIAEEKQRKFLKSLISYDH